MIGKATLNKMYREKLSRSLLFFAITPTIVVTGLFFLLFFFVVNDISTRDLTHRNKELASFLSKEITSYKRDIQSLQKNPTVSAVFYSENFNTELYKELYQIVTDHQLKSEFYIVNIDGEILLTNSYKDNTVQIYHKKYLSKLNRKERTEVTLYNEKDIQAPEYTFLKLTAPIYKGDQVKGFTIFDLQSSQLRRFYENTNYTDIVITDHFGNQLFTSKKSLISDNGKIRVLSDEGYHVVTSEIVDGDLQVHTIRYEGLLQKVFIFGFVGLLIICGLMVVITRLFAKYIAKKKTKSIDAILSTINDVNEGRYKGYKRLKEEDEFEYINYYLNVMIRSKDNLVSENKEIQVRKTEAEIKQLQMQFNPHFLFNTLENIKFMIRMNPTSAESLLLKLSSILRYSINNSNQESPLRQDLRYIQDYLEIQKSRFEERLSYSIDIPADLGGCLIPKLLMQPLVENAVQYGIDEVDQLSIHIKGTKTKKSLIIIISDTGLGFPRERLEEIRSLLRAPSNPSNHIGIYNVHRRIQLKYGPTYGVRIFSQENSGSRLIMKLPFREEADLC